MFSDVHCPVELRIANYAAKSEINSSSTSDGVSSMKRASVTAADGHEKAFHHSSRTARPKWRQECVAGTFVKNLDDNRIAQLNAALYRSLCVNSGSSTQQDVDRLTADVTAIMTDSARSLNLIT
ncbi:hypothetical protein BaRGS_00009508 [Batillaria attramentaria]|uniref:Uncharacterized protein n=1 Tax=Batillaria attramentaria TaxID=370345 RepID=A0ABD0LJG2_9CAEN